MDSVGIRVFSFSILPVIIAAGHLGLDRTSRPASAGWKSSCYICLGSVSQEAELVDSSVTSSFRTRSPSPSAGRPVIPSSSRLASPTWQ
jgi:hypothetical protein